MTLFLAFIIAGGLSGAIIAYSMDMSSPKEMAQGIVGGAIAGLLMVLMLPH